MIRLLKALHQDLRARISKWLRTREVIRVFEADHARELKETPLNMWPMVRERHAAEILAVRNGEINVGVVDRRSWAYPFVPESLHRLNQPLLKSTPWNLRKFSESPIPRRAINLVKNGVLSKEWIIQPTAENDDMTPEREKRIQIATECLKRPNNVMSFRELFEAVLEDIIIGGYGCIEPRMTPFYKRPVKMWAVDGASIRIYADWTESAPDKPRYAQMTGLKGERGIVAFLSDELIYIRDNVRSNSPFGLGKLEVAFTTVNAFLGVQDMASRAGADQIHKTFLWWKTAQNPSHVQTVRRYINNEAEGQAKVSLMAGMPEPTVVDVQAVTPQDLLLEWQMFLIKIIANAFDLSPIALGIDQHTNRATGQVMADSDFFSSIVPMAKRLEEAITRHLLHGYLQWTDIEFVFVGLEDPDANQKTQIQQRQYVMNAITPDEIREGMGLGPLPGGWGRLTAGQIAILTAASVPKGGAAAAGGGGMGKFGPPGAGAGTPGAQPGPMSGPGPGGGGGGIGNGMFSAKEIAQMSPDDIERNQSFGLLPQDTQQIPQQMEEEQPGILETLTEQLKDFFKLQEKEEEESITQPAKITSADNKEQQKKFKQSLHKSTLIEQVYRDRGVVGRSRRPDPAIYNTPAGKSPKTKAKGGVQE